MPSSVQITELDGEVCRELIDKSLLGLAIIQDKKLIYANRCLAEIIGYSLEEMLALSYDDFVSMIYPDDRNRILGALIDGISSNKLPLRQEFRISRKNGDIVWTDARANFIEFQGKPAMQVAFMDITSRKSAEAEVNAAKEAYGEILSSISDGFLALDAGWRFIYFNASAERILDICREEVLGRSFWEVFPLTLGTDLEREYRLSGSGEVRDFENFYEPFGRWFHNRCYPREGGGISIYFQDITERKTMEEELKRSERKFRSIVESSEEGISLIDDNGNIVEWNASQEYITGLKREEVLGRPAWDVKFQLIPKEQQTQEAYDKLKSFLLRLTDKGRVALKGWLEEQEILSSDGTRKNIHEVLFPIKTDKGYNIGIITHDITQRMRKEMSLRIKDEAIESALNAMSLANPSGDLFYANESWRRMLGYEKGEVEGKSLLDFLNNPKDVEEIAKQISSTGRWEGELVARKKDGSTIDIHLSASTVKNRSNRSICIISSFIDITENKNAQRKLEDNENKLKAIFDLVPVGIYVVDEDGRVISANQYFMDFMGLSLEDLNQKKHWNRRYFSTDGTILPMPEDTKDSLYKNFPAAKPMTEKKPTSCLEIGMEKENGEVVWANTMAVPTSFLDWTALVAVMDITEQRKIEESLRIKDAAIEASITATSIADLEGNLTYINAATSRLWGYEKDDVLGKPAGLFWEDYRKFNEVMDALFKRGSWSGDLVGRKKDGSKFDFHLSASAIKNAAGKPLCLHGSSLDITDRKKMERELREREERFRKVFELSPIGIQLFDADGFLVSANQASQRIMGITDTARHKRYNIFRDVLADIESQHKLQSGQVVNEGHWVKIKSNMADKINRGTSKDQKGQIYIENIIASLEGEGGEPEGYLCLQQDLTEHRLADEVMISENERLQIIYDIWKTRVKTSDMRMND